METVQFSYQIDVKDISDYIKVIIFDQKRFSIMNKIPVLLIIVYLLFLYVLINPTLLNIGILVFVTTILLTLIILIPLIISYYAKTILKKNPTIHHMNYVELNDEVVMVNTNNQVSKFIWKNVQSVYEGKSNIYCVFNNNHVLFIPKNRINHEELLKSLSSKFPQLHISKYQKQS